MNISFYLFVIISLTRSQIIIIPFKTNIHPKLTHENFILELMDNKISIELKIGTPNQNIPVFLKLNQIPFFLTSSSFNDNSINFNPSKSLSYSQDGNKTYTSTHYDYNEAYLGEDIISIQNISNKDSFLNHLQFFLATNLTEKNKNISGEIGLNIINPLFISFINQLKNKKLIKNYIFSLKYTTENEGEFHLGNYYHLYDDEYNENEFKKVEVGLPQSTYIDKWELFFYKIILSNGNNTNTNNVLLSYEFGLIYGTYNYYNLIIEIYFKKFGTNCEQKYFGEKEFYFVCENDINLEKFPDLIFIQYDFNFTLTKDELWKKFENKYYFLVIFSEEVKQEWILGKIFFKKYTIIFNSDEKIVGFYNNFKNRKNKNINKSKTFKISLSWILVIVLIFLLLLSIIYLVYYIKYKERKKRVNELEDKYDYISQVNNDNESPISINN